MKTTLTCIVVVMFAVSFAFSDDHPASPTTSLTTAPSDVTAVANSTAWITVTWKDAGNDFYYAVFRGTSADFQPDYYSEVGPPGSQKCQYDDDTRPAGKTFYYKVYKVLRAKPFTPTLIGSASATTLDHDEPLHTADGK